MTENFHFSVIPVPDTGNPSIYFTGLTRESILVLKKPMDAGSPRVIVLHRAA